MKRNKEKNKKTNKVKKIFAVGSEREIERVACPYCNKLTIRRTLLNFYSDGSDSYIRIIPGWQCPKCGRIYKEDSEGYKEC